MKQTPVVKIWNARVDPKRSTTRYKHIMRTARGNDLKQTSWSEQQIIPSGRCTTRSECEEISFWASKCQSVHDAHNTSRLGSGIRFCTMTWYNCVSHSQHSTHFMSLRVKETCGNMQITPSQFQVCLAGCRFAHEEVLLKVDSDSKASDSHVKRTCHSESCWASAWNSGSSQTA